MFKRFFLLKTMSLNTVEFHLDTSEAKIIKHKSWCGFIIKSICSCLVLCLGIAMVHYDAFVDGQNNHYIRTQFEYGLVKSLTDQHLIHEKPWAQTYEILDCIIGKWNLNVWTESDISHYKVIHKFFHDIQQYVKQNEFEIHQITLIIRDMHDIIVELDHFASKDVDQALRGFYSKNPWDARVTHTIFKFKHEMRHDITQCLSFWNSKQYFKAGESLGAFVGDYLYFEQTAQDFENEELSDLFHMNPRDHEEETTVKDVPKTDPLDKWRRKAKFRKF
eukprot:310081_1